MTDLAKRFANNPILRPADVQPSAPGMRVECLLNPGAFRFRGRTGLLLRVAERPPQTASAVSTPVLDPSAPGGVRIVSVSRQDPELKASDPRVFNWKGVDYLTTLSHLRLAWSDDGERFTADPKSIKAETLAALAVPRWLASEMELTPEYLRQLQRDPALWIRARPGTAAALAKSLFACERTDYAPDALRFTGTQDLFRTEQFTSGQFEIQDLASQLVGLACAPKPGETWWDTCAGEGGKTLHLADLMANKGLIWATDRHPKRLDTLKRRAGRAKLFNYRTALWDGGTHLPTKTKFDGILVDAPCSGVGTWSRNPHARWATSPDDVRELAVTQRALLEAVAGSLKPGGRLIYSVCTLTRSETTAIADAFTLAHPELEPLPLPIAPSGSSDPSRVMLWPQEINANGMFVAGWRLKKS